MAQPTQSLQRFRQSIKAVNENLRDLTQIRQDIVDQGAGNWIEDAAIAADLTKADVVAAAAAIADINATLDATDKTHRKALLKVEA
jgi:uncharacterized protein YjdB